MCAGSRIRDRVRNAVQPHASGSLQLINLDLEPCHEWVEDNDIAGSADYHMEEYPKRLNRLPSATLSQGTKKLSKGRVDKPCREVRAPGIIDHSSKRNNQLFIDDRIAQGYRGY